MSPDSSAAWFVGVQLPSRRDAFGERRSTESPQSVLPSKGPLPLETNRAPLPGSTTAPDRPQIAESLLEQLLGAMRPRRFEQREFHTWSNLPLVGSMTAT